MEHEFGQQKEKEVPGAETDQPFHNADRFKAFRQDVEQRHGEQGARRERDQKTETQMAYFFRADSHQRPGARGRDREAHAERDQLPGT